MKREQVIVTTLPISTRKQVRVFQVKLPRDTAKVIGVEMGLRWLADDPQPDGIRSGWTVPLALQRSLLVGDVKLQSCHRTGVFYSGELRASKGDAFGDVSSRGFKQTAFTHARHFYQDAATMDTESPLLQGIYRDQAYTQLTAKYNYVATVYVWIETKGDKH